MDSSTKWLLRAAAVMVIALGGTGILTMLSTINKSGSITVDIDKVRTTGNMCPSGWAYVGGGYCQQIYCTDRLGGHDSRLGGKGWKLCNWAYPSMRLKESTAKASTDERCPMVEPELGRNNSCQNGVSEQLIYKSDPPLGNIKR